MIRRFYVHNFRCLENFELALAGRSSTLLIGNNGSGKSTVAAALEILQKIGRGTNQLMSLISPFDGRRGSPIRFELEVDLDGTNYLYNLVIEIPRDFPKPRLIDESLRVDGQVAYVRESKTVQLMHSNGGESTQFVIDDDLVGLPAIPQWREGHPLTRFKDWVARILILRPVPMLMLGDSSVGTLLPATDLSDFGSWFKGLLAYAPAAYIKIDGHLRQVMPDLKDVKSSFNGEDYRSLFVQFSNDQQASVQVPFAHLSDGEKCFMVCAMVLAMNEVFGSIFCFWDEPDNYLALSEVGHFVMALRRAFQTKGQFVATSHNPEAIRSFSDENTLVLFRKGHLDPTEVRLLSEVEVNGDLVGALIRGDV